MHREASTDAVHARAQSPTHARRNQALHDTIGAVALFHAGGSPCIHSITHSPGRLGSTRPPCVRLQLCSPCSAPILRHQRHHHLDQYLHTTHSVVTHLSVTDDWQLKLPSTTPKLRDVSRRCTAQDLARRCQSDRQEARDHSNSCFCRPFWKC